MKVSSFGTAKYADTLQWMQSQRKNQPKKKAMPTNLVSKDNFIAINCLWMDDKMQWFTIKIIAVQAQAYRRNLYMRRYEIYYPVAREMVVCSIDYLQKFLAEEQQGLFYHAPSVLTNSFGEIRYELQR